MTHHSLSFKIILFFTYSLSIFALTLNINSGLNSFQIIAAQATPSLIISLQYDPALGRALLFVSKVSLSPSTSLSYYQHYNPKITTKADIEAANTGKKQNVNTQNVAIGDTIYYYIINFESTPLSVTVTFNYLANALTPCVGITADTSKYCLACLPGKQGVFCSYDNQILASGLTIMKNIPSKDSLTFTIPYNQNPITVFILTKQTPVLMFVQTKYYENQIAGFLNYEQEIYQLNIISRTYLLDILDISSPKAITIMNPSLSFSTNVSIWFVENKRTNILIIALGILGGILLILIVIAGIYIIYRLKQSSQVRPDNLQPQNQQDLLTSAQIQQYFPSVTYSSIFHQQQNTTEEIELKCQQEVDKDCVICLCSVTMTDLIKATYCRHVFHVTCLTQWFKKQRNCPYCRQNCNKTVTLAHYREILSRTNKSNLANQQLVKEIFKPKMNNFQSQDLIKLQTEV